MDVWCVLGCLGLLDRLEMCGMFWVVWCLRADVLWFVHAVSTCFELFRLLGCFRSC